LDFPVLVDKILADPAKAQQVPLRPTPSPHGRRSRAVRFQELAAIVMRIGK
jgi:hypothetical protein